jgi:hypothetical protein
MDNTLAATLWCDHHSKCGDNTICTVRNDRATSEQKIAFAL